MRKKKKRNPKIIALWLLLDMLVLVVIFCLLFHQPAAYQPDQYGPDHRDPNQIGQYLLHLRREFDNGSHTGKPFDLGIAEKPANQVIAGAEWEPQNRRANYWPRYLNGILFQAPLIACEPNRVTLMGKIEMQEAQLVITIDIVPRFDVNGLLILHVAAVKIGALNITPVARLMARQMYDQRLKQGPVFDDIRTRIAASLLNDRPFDPVFPLNGRKIRLTDVHLETNQLRLRFSPDDEMIVKGKHTSPK